MGIPVGRRAQGIINAVCHGDYADGRNMVVKIFDDRLENSNPGSLPLDLTVDDLRKIRIEAAQ